MWMQGLRKHERKQIQRQGLRRLELLHGQMLHPADAQSAASTASAVSVVSEARGLTEVSALIVVRGLSVVRGVSEASEAIESIVGRGYLLQIAQPGVFHLQEL